MSATNEHDAVAVADLTEHIPGFIQQLDATPLHVDEIEQVLRAARGAPRKAGRSWRGVMVTDSYKLAVVKSWVERSYFQGWRQTLQGWGSAATRESWDKLTRIKELARQELHNAPALAILCAAEPGEVGRSWAIQIGYAVLTAGRVLGIQGTLFPLAPLGRPGLARQLGLDTQLDPTCILTMGYPSHSRQINREPLSDAFSLNHYGKAPSYWKTSAEQTEPSLGKRQQGAATESSALSEAQVLAHLLLTQLGQHGDPDLIEQTGALLYQIDQRNETNR